MTKGTEMHEDLIAVERRAQRLRAEALAFGLRRAAGWVRAALRGDHAPVRSKTA